jgi:alkylation response protein AidB-like acyl-CoA dehydrogenase
MEIKVAKHPNTLAKRCRRYVNVNNAQQVQQLAVELSGDYAAVSQFAARQPGSNEAAIGPDIALTAVPRYFNGRAASIYGGSNEIQRNIIAKMVLGL